MNKGKWTIGMSLMWAAALIAAALLLDEQMFERVFVIMIAVWAVVYGLAGKQSGCGKCAFHTKAEQK